MSIIFCCFFFCIDCGLTLSRRSNQDIVTLRQEIEITLVYLRRISIEDIIGKQNIRYFVLLHIFLHITTEIAIVHNMYLFETVKEITRNGIAETVLQGMIIDFVVMEKMLKYFIAKAMGRRAFRKPRISVCVPSGITEIERKAVEEATYQAGAREVFLVEEPIAAAIGAGVDITKPFGNLIVDIGGGTTDIAVISIGGVVVSSTIKVAGDAFDQAIMSYIRKTHSLFIGSDTAEAIKIKIGTAIEEANPQVMEVKGRNVLTGLPKKVKLTSEEIRVALKDATGQIVEAVHGVLEKTPPELAADIVDRGIVLAGGGALLRGMDALIEQRTGVNTLTVQNAMHVVAVGTGKYAEIMSRMES